MSKLLTKMNCTVWLTGLSGSGKSTIARSLKKYIDDLSRWPPAYILDGDNIRQGLCNDLGFSGVDREENIRRVSEVAKLFNSAGFIIIAACISPYREDRETARKIHEKDGLNFLECFVDAPLKVCKERDPKGLYKKALSGEIPQFTGITHPYEDPRNPDIFLKTDKMTISECVQEIMNKIGNTTLDRVFSKL